MDQEPGLSLFFSGSAEIGIFFSRVRLASYWDGLVLSGIPQVSCGCSGIILILIHTFTLLPCHGVRGFIIVTAAGSSTPFLWLLPTRCCSGSCLCLLGGSRYYSLACLLGVGVWPSGLLLLLLFSWGGLSSVCEGRSGGPDFWFVL